LRFGSIFLAARFTFSAFLVGMAAALLSFLQSSEWLGPFRAIQPTCCGSRLRGDAGILSWSGMAILLIGGGKPGVWAALKRSVKRSNVHAVFLFLLGVESVVGSYLAWYAVRCGLPLALPAALTYTVWCR